MGDVPPAADKSIVLRLHAGCVHCGYDLFGQTGDPIRCPECGDENTYALLLENAGRAPEPRLLCAITAVVLGPALWVVPAWLGGRNEAWDSSWGWAWFVGTLIAAAWLGFRGPRFYVVSTALLVASEFVATVVLSGVGGLIFLGAALFFGVFLCSLLAGFAGAAFGKLERHGWAPPR